MGVNSQLSLQGLRDSHIPLEGFPEGNAAPGRLVYKGGAPRPVIESLKANTIVLNTRSSSQDSFHSPW